MGCGFYTLFCLLNAGCAVARLTPFQTMQLQDFANPKPLKSRSAARSAPGPEPSGWTALPTGTLQQVAKLLQGGEQGSWEVHLQQCSGRTPEEDVAANFKNWVLAFARSWKTSSGGAAGCFAALAELASRALKAERSRESDSFLVRRETNPRLRPARTTCGGLGPTEPKTKPHTDSNLWNKALTHKKPHGWSLEVFFSAFMAHPKLFEVSPLFGGLGLRAQGASACYRPFSQSFSRCFRPAALKSKTSRFIGL